jgi:hypothetical protein
LISWDWTSPYEICLLFVYLLPDCPWFFYRQILVSITICCPEEIRHQIYLNVSSCLSKCGQFGCASFDQEMSK